MYGMWLFACLETHLTIGFSPKTDLNALIATCTVVHLIIIIIIIIVSFTVYKI